MRNYKGHSKISFILLSGTVTYSRLNYFTVTKIWPDKATRNQPPSNDTGENNTSTVFLSCGVKMWIVEHLVKSY